VRVRIVRGQAERALVGGERLVVTLELAERVAAIVERFGIARVDCERPVVAGQRFRGPLLDGEGAAVVPQRIRISRPRGWSSFRAWGILR